jgi:lysozyme family protein
MDPFLTVMDGVLAAEGCGAYTDDPADHGGPTILGVTEAQARAAGYNADMRDMTRDQALAIYRVFYWSEPRFDLLYAACPDLGALMLNLGINCGTRTVGELLQRALNVLRLGGPALAVDGACGPMTRAALAAYRTARAKQGGDAVLLDLVRAFAAVRYVELAEGDASQREFIFGWLRRAFGVG